MYIELHTASAFSFLDGASLPETLVERATALGYPALALLDRDNVSGIPRFHLAARRAGLRAIVGAELTMRSGGPQKGSGGTLAGVLPAGARPPWLWRLPVLVASREGYRNLCRLITRMKLGAAKGEGSLTIEELDGHTRGLIALAGRAALHTTHYGVGGLLDRLVGIFGRANVCVELQRHLLRDEESDNQALCALASAYHVPIVATNGVRFANDDERPLFDVLSCLRHQATLTKAGRRLAWNAERYLKAPGMMARLFADLPQAIAATGELAARLEYTMADLGYRFPDYPVGDGETQASFLRKITEVGARERYRPYHERARAQVARELDLIEKLDLAGYFLIVWDIVNFCRQQGMLVQGRGSAANSAVCYSLGITAVDPVGMELLFERFLSEERGEWPDIDLDLPSGDRREQVIQYVYRRYGAHGAAMTANVITYRGRSAARDVGKVLEMDEATVDRLAKALRPFEWKDPHDTLVRHLHDAGLDAGDPKVSHFADLWRRMQDLPRHLGQHSGGMVVCQGRLDEIVPLEPASMPGRVVIQWDKEDCADMGLIKVDLLGLGMMAVLQDALSTINGGLKAQGSGLRHDLPEARSPKPEAGRGLREDRLTAHGSGLRQDLPEARSPKPEAGTRQYLDLAHLPPDDPVVYRMLQRADTVGVFQVESRAQMATLPRLKPRHFYDLVVEVALIRPGPIVGQMVHPYIKRRNGREPVVYAHPLLEPILERTLGVPLFQEQLLRMAMTVAGFTGGEAEELRRAMGFKRSEARMRQIEEKLRAGMTERGITGATADQVVKSITSFALYGFPESHAASFALIVYASAYLKAHYPAAFYAALLNNQPMGFYHPATLVKDAQRHGVRFTPIDVHASDWDCRVDDDGSIRMGLRYVGGLREEVGRAIERALPEARSLKPEAGRGLTAQGSRLREDLPEARSPKPEAGIDPPVCPRCGNDDASMIERIVSVAALPVGPVFRPGAQEDLPEARSLKPEAGRGLKEDRLKAQGSRLREDLPEARSPKPEARLFCNVCSHDWDDVRGVAPRSVAAIEVEGTDEAAPRRFRSLEHLIAVTGMHRDEITALAEIGALNSFGYDRRSALWQVERAIRPAGPLFEEEAGDAEAIESMLSEMELSGEPAAPPRATGREGARRGDPETCPLLPMSPAERVIADYTGTGLTLGPHPMAMRRKELALRGVLRAVDLPLWRAGRRVRVAGAVITRQRPGTAKGFVFLTLEDETGLANVIVQPDVFDEQRLVVVHEPYVVVEGVLQHQDDVVSVKAERVVPLDGGEPALESHDFH